MKNIQFYFSYNPINDSHWIKRDIHNDTKRVNTFILKTTYLDNKFATPEDIEEFEYLKKMDYNQYRIYALGEWGVLDLNHKFDVIKVSKLETQDPLHTIDGVKIFREPVKGAVYSMGIDSSRGRQDGDFTAIKLRRVDTEMYQDIASYKGKADETLTFKIAYNLANYYNKLGTVYIVPEVNNMGIYLVNKFKESDYPERLQYKRYINDETKPYDVMTPDYGFTTTSKTRPVIINEFADQFHSNNIEILDPEEKEEMLNFIWNGKRYEAQENTHDDLVMADCICLRGVEFIAQYG